MWNPTLHAIWVQWIILLSLKKLDVLDIESHLLNFNQSECTSSDLGFFIKLADGQFLA